MRLFYCNIRSICRHEMTVNRYASRLQSLLRRSLSIMTTPATAETSNTAMANQISDPVTPIEGDLKGKTIPHVPIPRRGVDYRGKVVLAPMVRSGELPSRLLALHYGADLVWGPETVDRSMIGTVQKTNPRTGCIEWSRKSNNGRKAYETLPDDVDDSIIYRIDPARESTRLIYQIGTADPDLAVQSASLVAPYVAGIDVNAGCPKPFSTSGGMGAALLRTPDLLASILRNLIEKVGKPNEIGISVKIRLLETPELTSALVHKLCETGIIGLTIHCRTTPMRPRERAIREQLRMIREICHSHGVACLMNGDVSSREEGMKLAEEYGCDGGMIATAAEANSSVFRGKEDGGIAHWSEVAKEYMKYAMSVENKFGNTKFLLSQLLPGKDPVYQKVTQSRSYIAVLEALSITDSEMVSNAKKLDSILKLDAPKTTKRDIKRANKQANKQQQKENERKKQEKIEQRKRAAENGEDLNGKETKKQRGKSRSRSPLAKAKIAAQNAGFEGAGEGALAVAV